MDSPITNLGFVPGQNLSPSRFSDAEIQAAERLVAQYLYDAFPTMDFVKGSALYDIVVRPVAMIYLISRLEWETLRVTQSLSAVIKNPEVSSNEIVDAILSNFQVSRKTGSRAVGSARMVFSKSITQSIPSTLVFRTADGLEFRPSGSYRIISDVNDISDIKLTQSGASQYTAIIPLESVERGAKYQISDGTPLFVSFPSSIFIAASSFGNFIGGSDDETNVDLINRLPEAMSVKNLASVLSISSTIKNRFPDVFDVGVQGSFDPVMTRNSHNLFGIKTGGFVDIYIKTMSGIVSGQIGLSASLYQILDEEGDRPRGTYFITIDKNLFPGHYFVRSIKQDPSSISSFLITSQARDINMVADPGDQTRSNLIPVFTEGVFSKYQYSTIVFEVEYDESLGTTVQDQLQDNLAVVADVAYIPGIADIQNMVSDRQSGVIMADYLVKAVIPCFVRLPIIKVVASAYEKAEEVRLAIYEYINKLKMGDPLKIDEMVMRIRTVPGVHSVSLPISVSGEILCPDGNILDIRSDGDLEIPYRPDLLVIPQNTAFFVELAEIDVEVTIS